jgi:hypothetical protein
MMTPVKLTGYRMEFRFLRDFTITDCIDFTRRQLARRRLPVRIRNIISITPMMYLALLHEGIAFVKCQGLF